MYLCISVSLPLGVYKVGVLNDKKILEVILKLDLGAGAGVT